MFFVFFFYSGMEDVFGESNEPSSEFISPFPHRAKLIQIPDSVDAATEFNNQTSPNQPILSTSQFKFPRKVTPSKPSSNTSPPQSPTAKPKLTNIPIVKSTIITGNNSIPTTYIQTNSTSDIKNPSLTLLHALF